MWIFLGILGGLAALIVLFLLLPFSLILKNDGSGHFLVLYRFFGKTFGDVPNPDSNLGKQLKKTFGLDRLKGSGEKKNLLETVSEVLTLVGQLLSELVALLKHCTLKKCHIKIVCATDSAADTAITYGRCGALVYGLENTARSLMKVRKRGRKIDLSCDFSGGSKAFSCDFEISVRVFWLLVAFLRLALRELRRDQEDRKAKKK